MFMSYCSVTTTTCGHLELRPSDISTAEVLAPQPEFQIYFLCLTHILWAKSHNILLYLFFSLPPFAFPFHFSLQGVVFIHQWKTLITPF